MSRALRVIRSTMPAIGSYPREDALGSPLAVAASTSAAALSCLMEPFEQLIENGISAGEIEDFFGRGDDVQFRESSLHLGVGDRALPGQQSAHSTELQMKGHHVGRERPDGANQVGDHFALVRTERHAHRSSNHGAIDPALVPHYAP
jgi:hypothetical protein